MSERARHGSSTAGRVALLTGALAVLAAWLTLATHAAEAVASVSLPAIAGTIVLLVAAEALNVRVRFRGDEMALTMNEAILAPAVVVFPIILVVPIVAGAQAAAALMRRNAPRKAAFNVAQWSLAAAAGAATVTALRPQEASTLGTFAAVGAALAVIGIVNILAFTAVVSLAQRRRIRAVARSLLPSIGAGWVMNAAFALPFVIVVDAVPEAIILFAMPMLALHWASRGRSAAAADTARLHGMNRALRALTQTEQTDDALPTFMAVVRDTFGAAAVEIVLAGAKPTSRLLDDAGNVAREPDPGGLPAALLRRGISAKVDATRADDPFSPLLRRDGWRTCLAAPLCSGSDMIGVICIYDRSGHEGFEQGELGVLEALASEAAGAIKRTALLQTITEEQRKLRDVIENTTDGILMVDRDGTVMMWNPSMETITGYVAEEMVGRRLLAAILPRDADGNAVFLEKGIEPGEDLPADLQVSTRGGSTRWVSCSYTRLEETEDRPAALIAIARDVTKERELDRLKEDFVATVSHELRTPLTPIMGWAETLVSSGGRLSDEERAVAASSILRQAKGLEALITNLLDVAKIERGVIDLREGIIDVERVVAAVVGQCTAADPSREIIVRSTTPHVRARGDEMWLERIVSNLLSNAVKYSPPGTPIEVTITQDRDGCSVAVTDHGPGIPPDEQEGIFDRFRRLGDHLTRSTSGTGLGLYIARQLSSALGGSLEVDSVVGRGSTFTLRLRAVPQLVAVG